MAFTNLDDGAGGELNNAFYDPSLPVFGFGDGKVSIYTFPEFPGSTRLAFSTSADPGFDFLGADCDNCLEVPNPVQIDSSMDGQGDACSSCTRVEWTEPPLFSPDQKPAEGNIALQGLNRETVGLNASGVFGLPHAVSPSIPLRPESSCAWQMQASSSSS